MTRIHARRKPAQRALRKLLTCVSQKRGTRARKLSTCATRSTYTSIMDESCGNDGGVRSLRRWRASCDAQASDTGRGELVLVRVRLQKYFHYVCEEPKRSC